MKPNKDKSTWQDKMAEARKLEQLAAEAKQAAMDQHREERRALRAIANAKAAAEAHALKECLEMEQGLGLHPKRNLLWEKSWDLGHSAGLSEVENYYRDLAELLKP